MNGGQEQAAKDDAVFQCSHLPGATFIMSES